MKRIVIKPPLAILLILICVPTIILAGCRGYLAIYNLIAIRAVDNLPQMLTELQVNLEAQLPEITPELTQKYSSAKNGMLACQKRFVIEANDGLIRQEVYNFLEQFRHSYEIMVSLLEDKEQQRIYTIKLNRKDNELGLKMSKPYSIRRELCEEIPIICYFFKWRYPPAWVYSKYTNLDQE